jgi:hypothetical protein
VTLTAHRMRRWCWRTTLSSFDLGGGRALHAVMTIEHCYVGGNPGGGVCVCTVACWFVGWGTLEWRSNVTAGRVFGREENLLVHVLIHTIQWASRCSSLSIPPWRAIGPRLLLCCVAAVQVGSSWGECQAIRVTSLVRVDVTRRWWMRAVAIPVCWARRRPMWSTPSVALTAQHGVRARSTGRLVIVTGATMSTSLLIYTAVGD